MRLSSLIAHVNGASLEGTVDPDILGVAVDSRETKPGFLFVAVPGTKQDGLAYIDDALAKGAVALVVSDRATFPTTPLPASVALVRVSDPRQALTTIAAHFYPAQPACLAAVTGTSGKTSTVQFARELWSLLGHKSASLGTLGLISDDESHYGSLTTPDPVTLHQTLDRVARNGVTHLALEASSHGIELQRLEEVRLSIGAFTNLSRDHLDYHPDMNAYFEAKKRLFTELLPDTGIAVLNAESEQGLELVKLARVKGLKTITYGDETADISLRHAEPLPTGQRILLNVFGTPHTLDLPLIGSFQAWNVMAALGIVLASGCASEKTVELLPKLSGVPGRLQLIGTTARGGSVFVDYAHKPDALSNVLETLRPHVKAQPGARLWVAFGCGGNRDKGKRPIMGEIATRLADVTIVTDDNPRREEAAIIRQEILSGCRANADFREIGDRKTAIHEAIGALGPGDVLVIAGKGHEEGQIVGDQVLPFNDAEIAREAIG